jgi:hypothetical protein
VAASHAGVVRAVLAANGEQCWRTQLSGRVEASVCLLHRPTTAAGTAAATTATTTGGEMLVCVGCYDGSVNFLRESVEGYNMPYIILYSIYPFTGCTRSLQTPGVPAINRHPSLYSTHCIYTCMHIYVWRILQGGVRTYIGIVGAGVADGTVCWTFMADGEVKCSAAASAARGTTCLVWVTKSTPPLCEIHTRDKYIAYYLPGRGACIQTPHL